MFDYILDKINSSEFESTPFRHIYIKDIFSEEHFNKIIESEDINLKPVETNEQLFSELKTRNYKPINFPGCTTDEAYYDRWHRNKGSVKVKNQSSCEAFGITYRLMEARSDIIVKLKEFIESEKFISALKNKFSLHGEYIVDNGIQKYLDGYEISPHPDIRRKALTYMVNINPGEGSERNEHHTKYLRFKPEFEYVKYFWEGNESVDRCWVPWDWCLVEKEQRDNNSLIIFAPENDTVHAVKADYDHYSYQRTQLYGNIWHEQVVERRTVNWEALNVVENFKESQKVKDFQDTIKKSVPTGIKGFFRGRDNTGKRNI